MADAADTDETTTAATPPAAPTEVAGTRADTEAPGPAWAKREVVVLAGVVGVAVAMAVVVAAVMVARGRAQIEAPPEAETYEAAFAGLCDSFVAARDGRVEDASVIFTNEVHGPLHDLAAAIGVRPAARLLQAKAAVEEDFSKGAPAEKTATDLIALAEVAGPAIAATGTPQPPPCRK